MNLRAVVLDMDGLMLDTEAIYKRAWQAAGTDLGYPLDDPFYLTLIGKPNSACEHDLIAKFGSAFPLAKFREQWSWRWKKEIEDTGMPTKRGLTELLAFLKQQAIPAAVATSTDTEYAAFSLKSAGLGGRFEIIVTGDQVAHGKPAPDIFLEAVRRLGVKPEDAVALEDSDNGVISATTAGLYTIVVPDLTPPSDRVRASAFCVVPSLVEAKQQIEAMITHRRTS